MCNAHNHPPGCECGWGGVWYGGGADSADWLFSRELRPRTLGVQSSTRGFLSGSYCSPNSNCPVCGVPVYFYKSPYGGRVFFDSLGPPWPKHGCTSGVSSVRVSASATPSWHQQNWHALSNVVIEQSAAGSNRYVILGNWRGRSIQLQFMAREIVMAEMIRLRKREFGGFDLSALDFDTTRSEWAVWEGVAMVDHRGLDDESKFLTRTTIHTHSPQKKNEVKPRPKITVETEPEQFVNCPRCEASVKSRNLPKHIRRIHGTGLSI